MMTKGRARPTAAAVGILTALVLSGACSPHPVAPTTSSTTTTTTTTTPAVPGTLTVSFVPRTTAGNGTVTSSPPGISCLASAPTAPGCTATFAAGTSVTLTATGATGLVSFRGWGGRCTGTATTCSFAVEPGASAVSAEFAGPVALCALVDPTSTGFGSVTIDPLGGTSTVTSCSGFSERLVPVGTRVTLTAVPGPSSLVVFAGWTGVCAGVTSSTCTFDVLDPALGGATNLTATARFAGPSRLTVNVDNGTAFGTVTANGSDSCTSGRTCSFDYPAGTTVSLVATPGGPAVTFGGWGGACSGAALTCTLTAPEASSFTVNAAFSFVP
jgi:hypothetical protein